RGDSATRGPGSKIENPMTPGHGGSGYWRPGSSGSGSEGNWGSGTTGSDDTGTWGAGSSRPSSGSGNLKPSNPDWGEFSEFGGSSSPATRKEYHTGKLVTSKGDRELLISNEKRPGSVSTTHRSCSKVITKTVIGPDGRTEVNKEVVTSEDGSDCGETDFAFPSQGSLDEFHMTHRGLSEFFGTDSTGKAFAELTKNHESRRQSMDSDSDIFRDLESDSHHFEVPELRPSSSKTSSYSKKTVTSSRGKTTVESKSLKLGDEAVSVKDGEEVRRATTTTRRGQAKGRVTRGIHTSPLGKPSLRP
ncbi:hypothetical protein NP188_24850, partial [Salmonella enterica]|nr:hypothetical protein [Salmonella enterica]